MNRSRMVVSWYVCVALLLVSGCAGEDPEPRFAAETTPAASESMSSSASPGDPATADETPEEFIHRWNDLDREMQTTGDTTAYLAAAKDCQPCEDVASRVEALYRDGGTINWKGRRITKVEHLGGTTYDVWFTAAPTFLRESEASTQQRLRGGEGKYQYSLTRERGRYFMSFMGVRPR